MNKQDIAILRPLALRYREIAEDPVNADRMRRARSNNGLKPARPLVWIEEVPWHEMNFDDLLTLRCEDPDARAMECHFRRTLYRWQYFQADMIVENAYVIGKAYDDTGIGLESNEQIDRGDVHNNIYSHYYLDQLGSMEQIELLKTPVITARPDLDAMRVQKAQEAFGDILPVRLRGHYLYHAPWDSIVRYHGVENSLCDLVDDPELMHAIVRRFTEISMAKIDQMNAQKLFDADALDLHCTPGNCDELDALSDQGLAGTSHCTWFRSMAQSFSSISPAMHDEFDIEYSIPVAKRFALSYYGCCEPLYDRIDIVKRLPNLRKIGVSAWSDIEASAEAIQTDYVFSRKPNPAQVAAVVDEEAVRADIRRVMRAVQRYNCPCDIVLKDISTVSYKPQNLFKWSEIVEKTIDEFY